MNKTEIKIVNREARYAFELLEIFDAGIVLTGTEVKSLRNGGGSFNDAYCLMKDGELWLKNLHIPEYAQGSVFNHQPTRLRKLLLKKKELKRIDGKIREKGLTVVPVELYLSERGFFKVKIALARGKKSYDKRETVKEREAMRTLERVRKYAR
ncbi:MAG: SsrA-binding protein SmpB [Chitinophagales bacterium]|nr:SsrA-binding protein SmpB [Chitinophagales bacterium]MDW8273426.1 SsrA-binding protein SmpB [Chitinophagales bacterium]